MNFEHSRENVAQAYVEHPPLTVLSDDEKMMQETGDTYEHKYFIFYYSLKLF